MGGGGSEGRVETRSWCTRSRVIVRLWARLKSSPADWLTQNLQEQGQGIYPGFSAVSQAVLETNWVWEPLTQWPQGPLQSGGSLIGFCKLFLCRLPSSCLTVLYRIIWGHIYYRNMVAFPLTDWFDLEWASVSQSGLGCVWAVPPFTTQVLFPSNQGVSLPNGQCAVTLTTLKTSIKHMLCARPSARHFTRTISL